MAVVTRKVLLGFGPNWHRMCILHGFKPDYILGDLGPMFLRSFGYARLENWGLEMGVSGGYHRVYCTQTDLVVLVVDLGAIPDN